MVKKFLILLSIIFVGASVDASFLSPEQVDSVLNFLQQRLETNQNVSAGRRGETNLSAYFVAQQRRNLIANCWFPLNDEEALAILRKEDYQGALFKAHRLKISAQFVETWAWGLSEHCREHNIGVSFGNLGDKTICKRVDSSLPDRVYVDALLYNPELRHWIYTRLICAKSGYVVQRDRNTGETVVVPDGS